MSTKTEITTSEWRDEQTLQTVFDEKISGALLWRMEKLNRFSTDDVVIAGRDIRLWDVVIGDRLGNGALQLGIVTALIFGNCSGHRFDRITYTPLTPAYSGIVAELEQGGQETFYINDNLTFRTITASEAVVFKQTLEMANATAL